MDWWVQIADYNFNLLIFIIQFKEYSEDSNSGK